MGESQMQALVDSHMGAEGRGDIEGGGGVHRQY
jgi:hypothetical protein